jgi:hypothetical protein
MTQLSHRALIKLGWLLFLVVVLILVYWPHTVRGTVSADHGPIAGAVVRLRATAISTRTDAQGSFVLPVRGLALHRTVTAWQEGYYIGAADLTGIGREVTIQLKPLTGQDHPETPWLPSDADPAVELACGNCHIGLHQQWRQSAHADAARNELVLMLYNGTDVHGRQNIGYGYRQDFPDQVGNCASCHAPGAAVDHPEGVDLNTVGGEAANGVFCQFCHAIDFARSPYAETTTGAHALKLLRPPIGQHLFIGPFDDVPGRDTYNPLYRQSQACAACHSGGWWGVPAYTSFDEWQASPYASQGVQCQDCHMAPDGKTERSVSACAPHGTRQATTSLPPAIDEFVCRVQACVECHLTTAATDGENDPTMAAALLPRRHPETLSTHDMVASRDETFLRRAAAMTVTATQGSDGVLVEVAITNVGAGHHLPTDSPLRHLILLVTARDAAGEPLPYLGDQVVPPWGGDGVRNTECGVWSASLHAEFRIPHSALRTPCNYAGLPGKGFAKVMQDYEGNAPAPPWRNGVRILSDNRIAALATDRSYYPFASPTVAGSVTVEVRLIYRRIFKTWADEKGLTIPDLVLAATTRTVTPQDEPVLAALPPVVNTTPFTPALATTRSGHPLDSALFTAPEQCGACHPTQVAAWQASAHAQATTSPLYRARNKVAAQDTHRNTGPFCAACHTPIGLLSGQIRTRWTWDGQESYPLDAPAQTGVACAVCHSIAAITGTANGAYVLDPAAIPAAGHEAKSQNIPGISKDPGNVEQPLLTRPEFCATCHEAVNPTSGLPVMTTYSEWRASRFNTGDATSATTCQSCHFVDGRHGELRPADRQQAVRIELSTPISVTGKSMTVRVQVSNTGVGHDLPTGATELRQVWLTIEVVDATGRQIFRTGEVDEYGDPVEGSITYGSTWLDAEGKPTERLWEAAKVLRDRRIPSGATALEMFQVLIPPDAVGPLQVRAALKYRAISGYLSSLMSIYLQEEVPAAPTIDMATAAATVPVRTAIDPLRAFYGNDVMPTYRGTGGEERVIIEADLCSLLAPQRGRGGGDWR